MFIIKTNCSEFYYLNKLLVNNSIKFINSKDESIKQLIKSIIKKNDKLNDKIYESYYDNADKHESYKLLLENNSYFTTDNEKESIKNAKNIVETLSNINISIINHNYVKELNNIGANKNNLYNFNKYSIEEYLSYH